jgi:hypothetical protein
LTENSEAARRRMLDIILIALTLVIFFVFDRYTAGLERL